MHAALDLARGGVSSRSLLRLLKTGLVDLPEQQQCALENYAYTWPLRAADWREPFTRSAAGYAGTDKEQDRQTLADAETARAFVMERVADFLPRTKNVGAAALTKQLYLFLQALGAEDTLNTLAETLRAQGRLPEADEVLREWNVVMGLLNQLALLLGDEVLARRLRRTVHAAAAHHRHGAYPPKSGQRDLDHRGPYAPAGDRRCVCGGSTGG